MNTNVSTVETALAKALEQAGRSKPADCTCHGWHTASVSDLTVSTIETLIEVERTFGCCPAEIRSLGRLLADRKAGLS